MSNLSSLADEPWSEPVGFGVNSHHPVRARRLSLGTVTSSIVALFGEIARFSNLSPLTPSTIRTCLDGWTIPWRAIGQCAAGDDGAGDGCGPASLSAWTPKRPGSLCGTETVTASTIGAATLPWWHRRWR